MTCLLLALAVWLALLSGCGLMGTSGPTSYIILEADTSVLPADVDVDDAMEEVEGIMKRRAKAFGGRVQEAQRQGTNRLALELSGMTAEEARENIGRTALLQFKEPQRDEEGNFVCCTTATCDSETPETFTVPSDVVGTGDAARPANLVPTVEGHQWLCVPAGQIEPTGNVEWVAATGIGRDDKEKALTGHFLKSNARVELMAAGAAPVVAIHFNSEGTDLFGQITGRLIGLPLAIFLDEEIIVAPTIRSTITGGDAVIEGVTPEGGRMLATFINSGALPIPVRVVAVGEGSLP